MSALSRCERGVDVIALRGRQSVFTRRAKVKVLQMMRGVPSSAMRASG